MLNKKWDGNWSGSEPQEAVFLEIKKPGIITIKPPGRTLELSRKTENKKGVVALHVSPCFYLTHYLSELQQSLLGPSHVWLTAKAHINFIYLLCSPSELWAVSFLLWLSCMRYPAASDLCIFQLNPEHLREERNPCFSWEGGRNHIAL